MKRHTKQNHKQKYGQFFTKNASELLSGYEHIVSGNIVTEPFAGDGDIVEWCLLSGAANVIQYDIEPKNDKTIRNDSILNPKLEGVVVTNPPYLSKNKNKEKTPYDMWKQNDIYKCHLAAIVANDIEKGILILPSNFLSERRASIRELFFSSYRMNYVKYFRTQVFDDATTGVVIFDFEKWVPESEMTCRYEIFYDDYSETVTYTSKQKDGWLVGEHFFKCINGAPPFKVEILREGMKPNSNIIIGLLDKGKYSLGAHYNDGDPIYCSPKAFTTYQCVLSKEYPIDIQRKAVKVFNDTLNKYRKQYHSLFLSNYMGSKQKILSRYFAERLLSHSIHIVESERDPII